MKIAISTSSFARYSQEPLDLLRAKGIEFVRNDRGRTLTEDEVIRLLKDCVGLVAGTEPLTRKVMNAPAVSELCVISRCGTSIDNVDMECAREKGIRVCNTAGGPTLAVAELTIGLMFALLRQIPRQDREMRNGLWKKRMGNLLHGKRVGIVGFGRIGHAVAEHLAFFGGEIAYSDPYVEDSTYPRLGLDDLMDWADIVTLHCSKPEGTGFLIDKGRLSLLRPGSFILNLARGGLIDEEALYGLLMAGHLGGAALDVYGKEPYDGPLATMENVILTPHVGTYAREARIILERDAVQNLINCLDVDE